mgnify:CR=1 FL=1
MYRRTHIILHHTGAEEKDAAQVRRYHLQKGWRDVGYNFIIERDGKVVTGRSLLYPGAHCLASNMNYRSIGIALIGNLELHQPTPAQVLALQKLLKDLMQEHNILKQNILLHKQVPGAKTLCPGRYFPNEADLFPPSG